MITVRGLAVALAVSLAGIAVPTAGNKEAATGIAAPAPGTLYKAKIADNGYKIYLSPSSQIGNGGCGMLEAPEARKIAHAIANSPYADGSYFPNPKEQRNLTARGYQVMVGTAGSVSERINESKRGGADRHIPIHTNALRSNFDCKVRDPRYGTLIAYRTKGDLGYNMARFLVGFVGNYSPGGNDVIAAHGEWAELRSFNGTAAYIEVEFHTWTTGVTWIRRATNYWAWHVADGIGAALLRPRR